MLGRLPCETPPAQRPAERGCSTRWVLPATILGSSMGFIDASVVNVALPAVQQGLEARLATVQWVVNGYMLTLAAFILLGGSASDRFGRRRMFIAGIAGFAVTSLACGLAPSAGALIAARLAQGAAAALLMPASLAIIGAAYDEKERGPAIGTWAAAGAVTTALGPALGGWLVDAVGWRTIFFINLPVAAAAAWLAFKLSADLDAHGDEPLDLRGALLAVAALGLLAYGLIDLGEGRRAAGGLALAAAAAAGAVFVRTEARSRAPMLPLSMFADREFAGANALTVLLYAALSGGLFLLPFMLIQVHGYGATAAGLAFLPFSAILGAGSRWTGGLVERIGARLPLMLGPAITAVGYVLLSLSGQIQSYWRGFLPGLAFVGIGMTLSVAPLTTTVFASAPEDRSGTASGINNAAARTGGLVAVAALGLAFGADVSSRDPESVARAYRIVMLGAAVLAAASAVTAAVTIGHGRRGR
jgi:EmrB/QacA subfamily drug resistance transporter